MTSLPHQKPSFFISSLYLPCQAKAFSHIKLSITDDYVDLKMPSAYPKNSDEWIKAARAYNLTGNTLCTWSNLLSGSKVSKEQFLLYPIVCPERKKPRELDLTWFGVPHKTIADAQEMLNQTDAYRHYLHNI